LNGYGLDGRALSLGEAEQDKVTTQSFNVDRIFLRGIILKKEEAKNMMLEVMCSMTSKHGAMNNERSYYYLF